MISAYRPQRDCDGYVLSLATIPELYILTSISDLCVFYVVLYYLFTYYLTYMKYNK